MTHDEGGTYLLEHLAPLTWSIGFVRRPMGQVAEQLSAWRSRLLQRGVAGQAVAGDLATMLENLQPIVIGYTTRELLVPTQNPEWTAYFAAGPDGADPAPVGALAEMMACEAAVVQAVPERPSPYDDRSNRRPNGGRSIEVFGDHPTDWLNVRRSVGVGQDGPKWRFEQGGEPFAFEDVEAYKRDRVKTRFTLSMLVEFAARLGLRPMDVEFYGNTGTLVVSEFDNISPGDIKTLAEMRREYDLI